MSCRRPVCRDPPARGYHTDFICLGSLPSWGCTGAWKLAFMSGNIFSMECLRDSVIALPETTCISCRFSGGCEYCQAALLLVGLHFQIETTPVKVLLGFALANCHVFTELKTMKILQGGHFLLDATVMWILEPLRMTMYIYIYICAYIDVPLRHSNSSNSLKLITYKIII